MKIENVKPSLTQTKNPLYFQLGIRVDATLKETANLSHEGMAFCVVAKDELKALMGAGFKPFAKATLDVEFFEADNEDPAKASLLKFELNGATFTGGMGTWETILNAPTPAKETPKPKGFLAEVEETK